MGNQKLREKIKVLEKELSSRRNEQNSALCCQSYLEQYFDKASVGFVCFGFDGSIFRINRKGASMLGSGPSGLQNEDFAKFISPDYQEDFRKHIQLVKEKNEPQTRVFKIIRPDGNSIFGQMTTSSEMDPSENQSYCMSMLLDVSKAERAKKALQTYNNFLSIASRHRKIRPIITDFILEIKSLTGCEAAGVRILDENGNLTFSAVSGFCEKFQEGENSLSLKLEDCFCSRVARSEADKSMPYFTPEGSFFTNDAPKLLEQTSEKQFSGIRSECAVSGFKSIALVPVRSGQTVLGLVHVADKHANMIDQADLEVLEKAVPHLGASILRSNAENETRRKEAFVSAVINSMDANIAVIDRYGGVIASNNALKNFFQFIDESFIPESLEKADYKQVARLISGGCKKTTQKIVNGIESVLSGAEKVFSFEFSCRVFGKKRWYLLHTNALPGKIGGAVISHLNIDQTKAAEKALQISHKELEKRVEERTLELRRANLLLQKEIKERGAAEARLRKSTFLLQTVFDGISDPLVLVDKNMNLKMINRSAGEYYGIDNPGEALGKKCMETLTSDQKFCRDCRIPEAVAQGAGIQFERPGYKDVNRIEQVVVYPVRERDDDGGAVIRIHDTTDQKLLEHQLIQNEKLQLLGMLVSTIAHEINNPNSFIAFNAPILRDYLEAILPFVDQYAENNPDLEIMNMTYGEFRADAAKIIDNIERGSNRIDAFLSNLREFARLNPKRTFRYIDVKKIMENAISIAGAKIRKSVKHFEFDISCDLPPINTDSHALEQVIINLLINAAQASDKEDSRIRVTVGKDAEKEKGIEIMVEDNGCGMDETTKSRIFAPFFTKKLENGGTGLGLYVSKNIINSLGGAIQVRSKLGSGSAFTIRLPDKEI